MVCNGGTKKEQVSEKTLSLFLWQNADSVQVNVVVKMSESSTNTDKTSSLVPENAAQVGGHSGAAALLFRDGRVLKPTTPCPREAAFYRAVLAGAVPPGLTPHCYGFENITYARYGTQTYVVMEDITRRYRRPCVLDLKIGTQTWDADCSPAKLAGRLPHISFKHNTLWNTDTH